jgi:hypothetical protein
METEKSVKGEIITRYVSIEGRAFALVKCVDTENCVRYGTIPYTEFDENGALKRKLNGFEMCLAYSIPSALEMRADVIKCEGMTEEQILAYFKKKIGGLA